MTTPVRATRVFFLLALAAVAAGCATTAPVRTAANAPLLAAQSAREAELAANPAWSLVGRLAVDAAGEGGSGRIEWQQRGDDYTIRLSAPVTRRSWVLEQRGGDVVLSGLDGGERRGTDAEAMLAEATGWRIPVAALGAWARGARAAGPAQIEFGPAGLPALISQHGWEVDYREWDAAEPPRPRRVFASRDGASVRLVVEAWGEP
jgi:outer membrane lipoprotein LolB